MTGLPVEVRTNGTLAATFIGGGNYTHAALRDGETLTLTAPPRLTWERAGSSLRLSWPTGILLEAVELTGPWATNAAAISPHTIALTNQQKFFRIQGN
jgi:hypothetical protein